MRVIVAILLMIAPLCSAGGAPVPATGCSVGQVAIPVEYRFADADVQGEWVYRSLHASLDIGGVTVPVRDLGLKAGGATFTFCAAAPDSIGSQVLLHVGPRSISLEARPVTKDPAGSMRMSTIYLRDQPRPDWVIVKSALRLNAANEALPTFELDLVNFGRESGGGDVYYVSQDLAGHCAFASPVSRVVVKVSVTGQRMKLNAGDPDFPEDSVLQEADIERNAHQCAGNFKLEAPFGKTGLLPAGPIRIRYVMRPVAAPASDMTPEVLRYFQGAFQFRVKGEGIWSADNDIR